MENNKIKISQSLMKDFELYRNKQLCGLQFKAKYYDDVEFPPTEAMQWGAYFEYLATGGLPRNGKVPVPERLKKGDGVGGLKEKWAKAAVHADRFKKMLMHYKFVPVTTMLRLSFTEPDGTELVAHLDLVAKDMRETIKGDNGKKQANPDFNQEVIIDLKFTGLLHDKWDDRGWELESLPEKRQITLQPVHYKYIYNKLRGRVPTFYFAVHSSANEVESRLIRINVDPARYEQHAKDIEHTRQLLALESLQGFRAYPTVKACDECPLNITCGSRITVPFIDVVDIG